MPTKNKSTKNSDLAAELAALRTELAGARRDARLARDVAKQAVAIARGTGDVTEQARAAVAGGSAPRVIAVADARVGDDGPTQELVAAVRALISDRPMTFPDLLKATGARRGRVSGAIVQLQKEDGSGIVKMPRGGDDRKALWWIPDRDTLAKLRR